MVTKIVNVIGWGEVTEINNSNISGLSLFHFTKFGKWVVSNKLFSKRRYNEYQE
jgi:hypothetical protein